MTNYRLQKTLADMLGIIITIGIISFTAQLIANLTIIVQLPKIKKYLKRIFQKLYNFESENQINYEIENIINQQEEEYIKNRNKKILENLEGIEQTYNSIKFNKETIEYIILAILIIIITIIIITKLKT